MRYGFVCEPVTQRCITLTYMGKFGNLFNFEYSELESIPRIQDNLHNLSVVFPEIKLSSSFLNSLNARYDFHSCEAF